MLKCSKWGGGAFRALPAAGGNRLKRTPTPHIQRFSVLKCSKGGGGVSRAPRGGREPRLPTTPFQSRDKVNAVKGLGQCGQLQVLRAVNLKTHSRDRYDTRTTAGPSAF